MSDKKITLYCFIILIIIMIICTIIDKIQNLSKKISELKSLKNQMQEIENEKKQLLFKYQALNQYEKDIDLKNEKIYKKLETLDYYKATIEKIANDNTQNSPWLAQKYADFFEICDTKIEDYLKNKKNPALKASEIVKQIKSEKKDLLKNNKLLQYQLNFLFSVYPWLESTIQDDVESVRESLEYMNNSDSKDDYDVVSSYLSPEEYQKLSNQEKYQLALDRYQKRKKSLWAIGISYERYIGYKYEMQNYSVKYNGALKGYEDLGRDLIAENNKEIIVIQCKYWKKERVIRENAVLQLYGTMILKQLETQKKVNGILITTTNLSDTAKKIAKELGIIIKENENFDKSYPCIKCNINKTTHEKIYHLPFDQQYDRIRININDGEKYVSTVKEAEELGFRKALKHFNN